MRIEAQLPLREKVAQANWVIDNNGSPEKTRAQVGALWEAFLERLRAR
jgi:dephospho-CoA kinase